MGLCIYQPESIKELWEIILVVSLSSISSTTIMKLYRREAREQLSALESSFTIFDQKVFMQD